MLKKLVFICGFRLLLSSFKLLLKVFPFSATLKPHVLHEADRSFTTLETCEYFMKRSLCHIKYYVCINIKESFA